MTKPARSDYGNPDLTEEMVGLLDELTVILANPVVEQAWKRAIDGVQLYVDELGPRKLNPWAYQPTDYLVDYFATWFTFLAEPNGGLGEIVPFTFLYLNNPAAFAFINDLESQSDGADEPTKEIFNWTVRFIKTRGAFMDSPQSLKYLPEWLESLGDTRKDFVEPENGYRSFNEFFTRALDYKQDPRPITAPDDNSILTASADAEINFIQTDLTMTTTLQVKSRQMNVLELLDNSELAHVFAGGTAVSCVLMPNSYHRYHSPVEGMIVESKEVPGIYNGVMDGEHWFNQGNIGESTTDFSIFEDFHRSYFVIKTEDHGLVAMIPVGLNTISKMYATVVNDRSTLVPPGSAPVPVKKGQELGHFAYGGSLNILLFQPGVFGSVNVLMGQRLGSLAAPNS